MGKQVETIEEIETVEIEQVSTETVEETAETTATEVVRRKKEEDTVDFIVESKVNERLKKLAEIEDFSKDELEAIAKKLRRKFKEELKEERERARNERDSKIAEAKKLVSENIDKIEDSINNADFDGVFKNLILSFVSEKLENAYLRKLGLIR